MKVADRLGPKGVGGWSRGSTSPTRGLHAPRSNCRYLRSQTTPEAETSKPRIFASTGESPIFPPSLAWVQIPRRGQDRSGSTEPTAGKRIASDAQGGAGVGSWKKRMPSCNRADTGSEFARRESEQTSRRCLAAKKCLKTILNGESRERRRLWSHVCAPPPSVRRSLMALTPVTRSALDIGQRAGRRKSAFEMLEPCAVKVARTVLRGPGGRQRPPGYSTAPHLQTYPQMRTYPEGA